MLEGVKRPITDEEVEEFCQMLRRENERLENRDRIKRKLEADRAQCNRVLDWKAWEFRHRRK